MTVSDRLATTVSTNRRAVLPETRAAIEAGHTFASTTSEAAPRTDETCSKPPDFGPPRRPGVPAAASYLSSMKRL